MVTLHQSDSIAATLVEAICTGNLESLRRLLASAASTARPSPNASMRLICSVHHRNILMKRCFCCQGVPKVLFHFARTVRRSDG